MAPQSVDKEQGIFCSEFLYGVWLGSLRMVKNQTAPLWRGKMEHLKEKFMSRFCTTLPYYSRMKFFRAGNCFAFCLRTRQRWNGYQLVKVSLLSMWHSQEQIKFSPRGRFLGLEKKKNCQHWIFRDMAGYNHSIMSNFPLSIWWYFVYLFSCCVFIFISFFGWGLKKGPFVKLFYCWIWIPAL